jgi:hypothetical protein
VAIIDTTIVSPSFKSILGSAFIAFSPGNRFSASHPIALGNDARAALALKLVPIAETT